MRQDLSINLFQLYLLSALSFYNKSADPLKKTPPPIYRGYTVQEMVVVLQNSSNAKLDSQYHMMAIRPISTLLVRLTVFSNKDFGLAAKYTHVIASKLWATQMQ